MAISREIYLSSSLFRLGLCSKTPTGITLESVNKYVVLLSFIDYYPDSLTVKEVMIVNALLY